MKTVFFILLAANLMLLAWILLGHNEAPTQQRSGTLPGVDSIVLLSEQGQAISSQVAGEGDDVEPGTDAGHEVEDAPAVATDDAGAEVPATEVSVDVADAQRDAPYEQPIAYQEPADACYTVGPFRDLGKITGIIRAIRDKVVEASFRSREESEQSLFWVYLAPETDLAAARVTTRALRANDIEDSFIITEGDKIHGISLGYFREKARAYRLRDVVAAKGFRPRIDPVFRNYTIYWLDYQVAPGASDVDPLAGQQLGESVSRFDRACG